MANGPLNIPAELQKQIVDSSSEMVKSIALNLIEKLKPFLYILIAIIILYILYKVIKFFLAWKKARREKLTYQNTEKILEKLENIERKLNITKKPRETKEKGKIKRRKP